METENLHHELRAALLSARPIGNASLDALADAVFPLVQKLAAERDAHVRTLDHMLTELHATLGGDPADASLAAFPDMLEAVENLREQAETRERRERRDLVAARHELDEVRACAWALLDEAWSHTDPALGWSAWPPEYGALAEAVNYDAEKEDIPER